MADVKEKELFGKVRAAGDDKPSAARSDGTKRRGGGLTAPRRFHSLLPQVGRLRQVVKWLLKGTNGGHVGIFIDEAHRARCPQPRRTAPRGARPPACPPASGSAAARGAISSHTLARAAGLPSPEFPQAKNLSTQTARIVVALQKLLPKAYILYSTATGAPATPMVPQAASSRPPTSSHAAN